MRVRILTSIAGHAQPIYKLSDFSFAPGDTPSLHKKLAEAWIESGIAEAIKPQAAETADAEDASETETQSPGPVEGAV